MGGGRLKVRKRNRETKPPVQPSLVPVMRVQDLSKKGFYMHTQTRQHFTAQGHAPLHLTQTRNGTACVEPESMFMGTSCGLGWVQPKSIPNSIHN